MRMPSETFVNLHHSHIYSPNENRCQFTKEVKTPLNANAVAFVPSATATPDGPPGRFSNQQTPNEGRPRVYSTLPEPHKSLPTRRDWVTPPHRTITHPPRSFIHPLHPPVAHPLYPPNLPAPGTWNPHQNATYIGIPSRFPDPTNGLTWNKRDTVGAGNQLGARIGQHYANTQQIQFGNGAYPYPYPVGFPWATHQFQGQYSNFHNNGMSSGISSVDLATSFAIGGTSRVSGGTQLGGGSFGGGRGGHHGNHEGGYIQGERGYEYQQDGTGGVPNGLRGIVSQQPAYWTRADRNEKFDRGNGQSRGEGEWTGEGGILIVDSGEYNFYNFGDSWRGCS